MIVLILLTIVATPLLIAWRIAVNLDEDMREYEDDQIK